MCVGGVQCHWHLTGCALWQPWLEMQEEARKSLPSVRWRRDRRARDALPDYATASQAGSGRDKDKDVDGPLDMSTRGRVSPRVAERAAARAKLAKGAPSPLPSPTAPATPATPPPPPGRGSPPSYSEAISKPGYRLPVSRPSVITCAPPSPTLVKDSEKPRKVVKDNKAVEASSGDGMCDPVIDEHFRRSLGKDYLTLFAKKNSSSKSTACSEEDNNGLSITGLSVDDHFAKALGDTWVKLQKESAKSPLPSAPAKSSSNESSNATIPRPRRGLVTI